VVELAQHPAPPVEKRRGLFGMGSQPPADDRPRSLVSYSLLDFRRDVSHGAGHHRAGKPGENRAAGDGISHQREVRPREPQRFDCGCRRLVRPALGFLVRGHASLACSFHPQIAASTFLVAGLSLHSALHANALCFGWPDTPPFRLPMKQVFLSILTTLMIVATTLSAMVILVRATLFVTSIESPLPRAGAIPGGNLAGRGAAAWHGVACNPCGGADFRSKERRARGRASWL